MITKFLVEGAQAVKCASECLRNNEVIAFKTDTIYGLSTNVYNQMAVDGVFVAKSRYEGKPLITLVPQNYDITKLVKVSPNATKLMNAFWPGPLTIIYEECKNNGMAQKIGLNGKVSLRMPNSKLCLAILNDFGSPITSTSANISGEATPNNGSDILDAFDGKISLVIDSGVVEQNIPSTIVDASGKDIIIIRDGAIQREKIEQVLGKKL